MPVPATPAARDAELELEKRNQFTCLGVVYVYRCTFTVGTNKRNCNSVRVAQMLK